MFHWSICLFLCQYQPVLITEYCLFFWVKPNLLSYLMNQITISSWAKDNCIQAGDKNVTVLEVLGAELWLLEVLLQDGNQQTWRDPLLGSLNVRCTEKDMLLKSRWHSEGCWTIFLGVSWGFWFWNWTSMLKKMIPFMISYSLCQPMAIGTSSTPTGICSSVKKKTLFSANSSITWSSIAVEQHGCKIALEQGPSLTRQLCFSPLFSAPP